jgi:hypothetical protein
MHAGSIAKGTIMNSRAGAKESGRTTLRLFDISGRSFAPGTLLNPTATMRSSIWGLRTWKGMALEDHFGKRGSPWNAPTKIAITGGKSPFNTGSKS